MRDFEYEILEVDPFAFLPDAISQISGIHDSGEFRDDGYVFSHGVYSGRAWIF
jgi:hypothetical protein